MSSIEVDFVAAGQDPSQEQLSEVEQLVVHLLQLPAFAGKHPSLVLNALVSAYWTAANVAGMQAQAAQGMVQIGGSYLARLALAQHASDDGTAAEKPVVH